MDVRETETIDLCNNRATLATRREAVSAGEEERDAHGESEAVLEVFEAGIPRV